MRHYEIFTGRIGQVRDLVELANGNCVVNFSVAETPRVKRGDNWEDGVTIWTNIAIFGDEARNLVRSVKPGTFVTVIGHRQAREYTPKDSTEKRTTQSIVAEQVAVSITKFNYIESIGNVNYAQAGRGNGAPQSPGGQQAGGQTNAGAQPDPFNNNDPFGGNAPGNDSPEDDPFSDENDPFSLG